MTRDPTPAPPHIPDYALLREIGRGSYGTVWLARSVTGLYRAVKIVWQASFEDPQPYEREFRGIREFAAVSLIEPRQLALLHVGRNDAEGFFYYVMELADDANSGRDIEPHKYVPFTLRELRTRSGRLPADEVLTLAVDLAGALAGLHAHKLVHRDIKPSNIIFVGGVPKLADLGLVTSAATAAATISRVGNPGYMPPDFPGTASADVYGLGKVLYEIVTGRERDDYPRLPADLDRLPDRKALLELNEIFIRACATDPEKRYASAAALRDDLLLLQAGKSVRRLRAAEKRLGQALRVAVVLAIAASVAGAAAWLATREARKEMALRATAEKQRDELMRKSVYVASLAQAQRALEQNDFGRAIQLLDAIQPAAGQRDWRGFEWRALRKAAAGDPSIVIRQAGSGVQKFALSPDNLLLAVLDAENDLTTYRTDNFAPVSRIPGVIRLAGFSPEGDWLVGVTTVPRDGKPAPALQRWRVPNGTPDAPMFPAGGFRLLGTRADGQVVTFADATSSQPSPTLSVWDFNAHREVRTLSLGDAGADQGWRSLRAIAAAGGQDALVAFVQGQTPDVRYRVSLVSLGPTPSFTHATPPTRPGVLGFIAQGERNLAWTADPSRNEVAAFAPASGTWQPAEEQLPIASVIVGFPMGGTPLLAAAQNSTIALVAPARPKEALARAHGHAAPIVDLAVTADGTRLFSAGADGEVRAWESAQLFRNRSKREGWDIRNTHTPIAYSADGRRLLIPENGENVLVLDAESLQPLQRIERMRHAITAHQNVVWGLHADRKSIVSWDERTNRLLGQIGRSEASIVQVTFSPDKRFVCFTRANGQLCFGPTDSTPLTVLDGAFAAAWPLQLGDDCRRLWFIDSNRHLACHSLPTGEKLWAKPISSGVISSMDRGPGTEKIFVGVEDGTVHVFDATTGARRRMLRSGGRAVEGVQLLPDRSRLLIVDIDGDVHSFETDEWTRLGLVSTGARNKPYSFAVSADSRRLAFLTVTGTLHTLRTD